MAIWDGWMARGGSVCVRDFQLRSGIQQSAGRCAVLGAAARTVDSAACLLAGALWAPWALALSRAPSCMRVYPYCCHVLHCYQ